jgi:large subunit ribosomal protein L22
MQFATQEFRAAARFQRVSPQKARLVLDLIKHRRVEDAMNTLAFTKKGVAPAISKLLRSAVENANYLGQEKGIDVDIDNLYVKRAVANEGPRMKRIRPAPMGRAYRYQRRMAHIEIALAEKAASQANGNLATVVTDEPAQAAPAKQGKTAGAAKKGGKKKAAQKKSAAKKKAPGKKK